ncbi:flagellar basal body L-ring protein FlgH [Shigella flexneri]
MQKRQRFVIPFIAVGAWSVGGAPGAVEAAGGGGESASRSPARCRWRMVLFSRPRSPLTTAINRCSKTAVAQIGDTLIIVLQETLAPAKAAANASRDGKTNFGFDTVPRYLQALFGNARADAGLSGGNTFNGKGGANASNTFKCTLLVTVDQVPAKRTCMWWAKKQIAINQGTEFIRFSGTNRTISGSNTAPAPPRWRMRVSDVGNGYINEAQRSRCSQKGPTDRR